MRLHYFRPSLSEDLKSDLHYLLNKMFTNRKVKQVKTSFHHFYSEDNMPSWRNEYTVFHKCVTDLHRWLLRLWLIQNELKISVDKILIERIHNYGQQVSLGPSEH